MATDDERSGGWYTHTDADEANLLKAKIKSAICSHKNEDDLYEAYEGSTFHMFTGEEEADKRASMKKAKRQLWAIVCQTDQSGLPHHVHINQPP